MQMGVGTLTEEIVKYQNPLGLLTGDPGDPLLTGALKLLNRLWTVDLKFDQSQGLSTFWDFFYLFIIKPVFYLSW